MILSDEQKNYTDFGINVLKCYRIYFIYLDILAYSQNKLRVKMVAYFFNFINITCYVNNFIVNIIVFLF